MKRVGIRLVEDPRRWWCAVDEANDTWAEPTWSEWCPFALTWPASRELRWCYGLPLVVINMGRKAALCWAMDAEDGTPIDESIDSRVRIGAREDTETPGRVAWATEDGTVVARVEEVPE